MENTKIKKHVPSQQKAKVGARYKNIHTDKVCTVTSSFFFTIEYRYDDGFRSSMHYKTFKQNWIEMTGRDAIPIKCRRCGMDCVMIGGSQWLEWSCEKEVRVVGDG